MVIFFLFKLFNLFFYFYNFYLIGELHASPTFGEPVHSNEVNVVGLVEGKIAIIAEDVEDNCEALSFVATALVEAGKKSFLLLLLAICFNFYVIFLLETSKKKKKKYQLKKK
jgi:hypothetical protein